MSRWPCVPKPLTGLDRVIVDDAQRSKLPMCGVVVIGKRKAVPGIQPAVIGMAPFLGSTYFIRYILLV